MKNSEVAQRLAEEFNNILNAQYRDVPANEAMMHNILHRFDDWAGSAVLANSNLTDVKLSRIEKQRSFLLKFVWDDQEIDNDFTINVDAITWDEKHAVD